MRLSTKGRFAVTAMIDVALREKLGPVPLSDIATRQQISLSYLEQMFSKLRQHGLVDSTRGPGGGYTLGHRAEAISVADIIGAVEDEAPAKGSTETVSTSPDMAQDLWNSLNAKVMDFMQSITLRSSGRTNGPRASRWSKSPRPTAASSRNRRTSRCAPPRRTRCLRWASHCWQRGADMKKCEVHR